MINFIVCEDNKVILQKNIDIINKVMFKNNINYRIYPFTSYDEELRKLIKQEKDKTIYILDIELDEISGIDIAKEIRNDDLNSFILISTAHTEFLPYTLKSKLLIYDYISKFYDYEEKLTHAIMSILSQDPETNKISIKIRGKEYNIDFDDIISIKHDNIKRKTIIKTKDNIYEVNMTLSSITKNLDNRFVKQKDRSIININNKNYDLLML